MAVIGVYSAKGGVGKTTMAVDLAWRSAASSGHRTLLWDIDPQGASAFLLGAQNRSGARAASVFQREGRPRELIETTRYEKLWLLQSDESLRSLSVVLARIGHRKRLAQLTTQLLGEYDRIVLDCPPVLNEISEQIVHAADVLIVPLPPSPLAMRMLESVRAELLRSHSHHPPILPVLSMYDARRRLHREVREGVAADWPVVPMSSQIEQVAVRQAPLGSFANWSEPSRALQRVWLAVESKIAQKSRRSANFSAVNG